MGERAGINPISGAKGEGYKVEVLDPIGHVSRDVVPGYLVTDNAV